MKPSPEWYQSWFESPWYMRLYRHRTDEEAQRAVRLIEQCSGLERGARLLDLCCGYGRHALALAERGYHVSGVDISHYLIDRAREVYPHENVTYSVGDMRGPYPGAPFDGIVNFFTSFGYFDVHDENAAVFRAVYDALRPGGIFVMDFFNARRVRETLLPESMTILDDVTIIQERRIEEPFVRKSILVSNPCSYELEFEERVWLYTADELVTMASDAGLMIRRLAGGYEGAPFDETTSDRCILFCQKP
ncbi:MAG TPA: class I SAM-dependent methyltransferase [Chlorobiota bacterium]|nr:class I SAM-dependent methyltransferase [Chlorobiota bacterium]